MLTYIKRAQIELNECIAFWLTQDCEAGAINNFIMEITCSAVWVVSFATDDDENCNLSKFN